MKSAGFKKVMLLLIFGFGCAAVVALLRGSVDIPWGEIWLKENEPIMRLRALRIIVAAIAGIGLSVSGVVLQAVLRNPLAEPYLLGISSGAGLGAVIAVVLGSAIVLLPAAAFIGAVLSIGLVYLLARQHNRISEQSLILSGVIVSVGLSALIVFCVSISSNEALRGLTWWLWGSFQMYDLRLIMLVAVVVLSGVAALYIFAQDLNAMSIGEEEAHHLGINTEAVKKILLLLTSLVTAAIVSTCGIIGFVGLLVPHLMRLIVGPNHKVLIPATALGSAVFMVACDMLSRTIYPPYEVPVGVITALLGAPVFIILLRLRQR